MKGDLLYSLVPLMKFPGETGIGLQVAGARVVVVAEHTAAHRAGIYVGAQLDSYKFEYLIAWGADTLAQLDALPPLKIVWLRLKPKQPLSPQALVRKNATIQRQAKLSRPKDEDAQERKRQRRGPRKTLGEWLLNYDRKHFHDDYMRSCPAPADTQPPVAEENPGPRAVQENTEPPPAHNVIVPPTAQDNNTPPPVQETIESPTLQNATEPTPFQENRNPPPLERAVETRVLCVATETPQVQEANEGRANTSNAQFPTVPRPRQAVLQQGDRVLAQWHGHQAFFPGVISSVRGDDLYDVTYEAGELESLVKAYRIRQRLDKSAFHQGEPVLARFQGGRRYFPGWIMHVHEGDVYSVVYDGLGDREDRVMAGLICPLPWI